MLILRVPSLTSHMFSFRRHDKLSNDKKYQVLSSFEKYEFIVSFRTAILKLITLVLLLVLKRKYEHGKK